jgi:dCTP deaminase
MGRLGIASHVTAGFGDYGFKDYWTLEIVNMGKVSVILRPGMRIGQISFEAVYEPLEYEGAYKDVGELPEPKAPKLGKDRF